LENINKKARKVRKTLIFFTLYLAILSNIFALDVISIEKFLEDSSFDAWSPSTNQVLFPGKKVDNSIYRLKLEY